MWLKSHKWVDIPCTRTEKRWAMNVRESVHTAMVFDKKYLNVETGKFDTDKLHTLNSLSLNDLVETDYYRNDVSFVHVRMAREQPENKVYNFPKHVPKDNDFDEEIKRDEEKRRVIAKNAQRQLDIEKERKRREEEFIKHQQAYEEKRRMHEEKQQAYARQLAETEERLIKERNDRHERMKQAVQLRHVGNVRPNVWRPK